MSYKKVRQGAFCRAGFLPVIVLLLLFLPLLTIPSCSCGDSEEEVGKDDKPPKVNNGDDDDNDDNDDNDDVVDDDDNNDDNNDTAGANAVREIEGVRIIQDGEMTGERFKVRSVGIPPPTTLQPDKKE